MTKIKTCGLFREQDIDYVNQYLPDYAGFVIRYAKSHRSVSPERAEQLIRLLNPGIISVGVVANQPLDGAIELLGGGTVDILQLHGDEDDAYVRALQTATGRSVWKAFVVRTAADLADAEASSADMIVLDNGRGTGRTFDWDLLEGFSRPYFLAGGLNPGNVVRAIHQLHPYGVDLSGGLETDGRKDKGKISSVIAAVRGIKEQKG